MLGLVRESQGLIEKAVNIYKYLMSDNLMDFVKSY